MGDSGYSRDESLLMYRYLCDHVVGSEDVVRTRRQLINAIDNLAFHKNLTFITSGSYGEGLMMKGSDVDIMCLVKTIKVYENIQSIPNDRENVCLVMETKNTKIGFTKLLLMLFYNNKLVPIHDNYEGLLYLLHELVLPELTQADPVVIHGPCLSDKYGLTDTLICFHNTKWISLANPWITRSSESWPCREIKSNIMDHGVLFVPIGAKGSPTEDVEWRISFSVGEKILINSFCHTQLLCYALMKILLKDVISLNAGCKNLLCSFFIKNIMFWVCEEIPLYVWKPYNLLPCFLECFKRLIYCVHYSVCPHYFIPEINLFENKIEGYDRINLLDVLNTLYHHGWRCILNSDQFCELRLRLDYSMNRNNFKSPADTVYIGLFKDYVHRLFFKSACTISYEKIISRILFSLSSGTKSSYLHRMSSLICEHIQQISVNSINENKNQYRQYHKCITYMLQSTHGDASSGWLMLALLFYQTTQYKKAIYILSYMMNKFSTEKIYSGNSLSLKSIKHSKKLRVPKFMHVQPIVFVENSSLMPKDGHSIFETIPKMAFCHFLSFICHYKLKDIIHSPIAVRELHQTIAENYFVAGKIERELSYFHLGVALMLLGDRTFAEQAFSKAT